MGQLQLPRLHQPRRQQQHRDIDGRQRPVDRHDPMDPSAHELARRDITAAGRPPHDEAADDEEDVDTGAQPLAGPAPDPHALQLRLQVEEDDHERGNGAEILD